MSVRRRGKGGDSETVVDEAADVHEKQSLLRMPSYDANGKKSDSRRDDDGLPEEGGRTASQPSGCASTTVSLSRESMGIFLQNLGSQIKNMDFEGAKLQVKAAAQAYWAAARDWVSDVPSLVQRMQDYLPDRLQPYTIALSKPLTPEQQACARYPSALHPLAAVQQVRREESRGGKAHPGERKMLMTGTVCGQELVDKFIEDEVGIPYTHDDASHWALLLKLWNLAFPASESQPEQQDTLALSQRLSTPHCSVPRLGAPVARMRAANPRVKWRGAGRHWKKLGFQGNDPATDFRSAGVLSVKSLVYFGETYPDRFQETMQRSHGRSVEDSYPFACAAINVVFLLTDLMKLRRSTEPQSGDAEAAAMRATLGRMLDADARAFSEVFCVVLLALDDEWVRTKATYMQFPNVLKATRARVASALRNGAVRSAGQLATRLSVDLYRTADANE
jgi:hypothetical protein